MIRSPDTATEKQKWEFNGEDVIFIRGGRGGAKFTHKEWDKIFLTRMHLRWER